MLEGSKHENGTDPDGWRAADRSKNLRHLFLDRLDLLFEPDDGHLHQSAVVACEEVCSLSDLAASIVDVA